MSLVRYIPNLSITYQNDHGKRFTVKIKELCDFLKVEKMEFKLDIYGKPVNFSGSNNIVFIANVIDISKGCAIPPNTTVIIRFGFEIVSYHDHMMEIDYSRKMADNNIGPVVFYPDYTPKNIKETMDTCFMINPVTRIPLFVTEYFNQGSLEHFLSTNPGNFSFPITENELFELKKEATLAVTDLLNRMVDVVGIYCVDIKPGNFVVNIDYNSTTHSIIGKTRMIDFGSDFCFDDKDELINDPNENSIIKCILLVQMLAQYIRADKEKGDIANGNLENSEKIMKVLVDALDKNNFNALLSDIKTFARETYNSRLAQMITWYSSIIGSCTVDKKDVEKHMIDEGLNQKEDQEALDYLQDEVSVYTMMEYIENTNEGIEVFKPFIQKCVDDIFNKIYPFSKNYVDNVKKGGMEKF